ncbi:MAG: hypothetical protein HQL07_18975 [Nitrospirae bacterium]|nr:hypothetical protein [Magnetococcales bacterium]
MLVKVAVTKTDTDPSINGLIFSFPDEFCTELVIRTMAIAIEKPAKAPFILDSSFAASTKLKRQSGVRTPLQQCISSCWQEDSAMCHLSKPQPDWNTVERSEYYVLDHNH